MLPVTGSESAPQLGGSGPAIEYVLKMRQFPQSQLLSAVQARAIKRIDALRSSRQTADFISRCLFKVAIQSFHLP